MMWTIWVILVSVHINQVFASPSLGLAPTPRTPLAPSWIVKELAPDFHSTWWKSAWVFACRAVLPGMNSQCCKLRESIRHSHYLLLWVIDAKYPQSDVNIILLCSRLLAPVCIKSAVTGCQSVSPCFLYPLEFSLTLLLLMDIQTFFTVVLLWHSAVT